MAIRRFDNIVVAITSIDGFQLELLSWGPTDLQ